MSTASCGSRLPVGSSANSNAGSPTIARAIATRCCSPPESTLAKSEPRPDKPTRSSTSPTRVRITRGGRPSTSSGKATLSSTLQFFTSLKSWKMIPIFRRKNGIEASVRRPISRPRNRMRPASTFSAAYSSRKSVLLPAPEGPVMNTNSPRAISSCSPRSTGKSARYALCTSSKVSTARCEAVGSKRLPSRNAERKARPLPPNSIGSWLTGSLVQAQLFGTLPARTREDWLLRAAAGRPFTAARRPRARSVRALAPARARPSARGRPRPHRDADRRARRPKKRAEPTHRSGARARTTRVDRQLVLDPGCCPRPG